MGGKNNRKVFRSFPFNESCTERIIWREERPGSKSTAGKRNLELAPISITKIVTCTIRLILILTLIFIVT